MSIVTYSEPVQPLDKCVRCGFEASAEFIVGSKCVSCREAESDPELKKERVTVRTVQVRASRRFGHVPDFVKRILEGKKSADWIDEVDLPPTLRWKPSAKRKPRRQDASP